MQLRTLITTFLVSAGLALAGAVSAQERQQPPERQEPPERQAPPQQPPQHEPPEVTDEEVEKYAKARAELQQIQQEYSGRLQQTEDPQDQQRLQQQANEEMQQAIAEVGLDVRTYNEISMAVEQDPELREKVERKIDS